MTSKHEKQIFNNNNNNDNNNFFGLAIIYYQVYYVIIKVHISSKQSTRVTKKYII